MACSAAIDELRRPRVLRQQPRRFTLRLVVASVAVGALATGLALGFTFAPRSEAGAGSTDSGRGLTVAVTTPGFIPALGWESISTGTVEQPVAAAALAATVPIATDDFERGANSPPRGTIASLPLVGIVITAIFYPRDESSQVDDQFSLASGPLAFAGFERVPPSEGQPAPDRVAHYRRLSVLGGVNADISIYSGSSPDATMIDLIDDQLARLVAPR